MTSIQDDEGRMVFMMIMMVFAILFLLLAIWRVRNWGVRVCPKCHQRGFLTYEELRWRGTHSQMYRVDRCAYCGHSIETEQQPWN